MMFEAVILQIQGRTKAIMRIADCSVYDQKTAVVKKGLKVPALSPFFSGAWDENRTRTGINPEGF